MLDFHVNPLKCSRCGECLADCPARIIAMPAGGFPAVATESEERCYRCGHCIAICPRGALSILGTDPEELPLLAGKLPEPERLEILIRGRRSVRRYRDANVEPELLQHLLETAWQAPTGINFRQVRFAVVDDRERMQRLRREVLAGLAAVVREERLPEGLEFFADLVRMWEEHGVDGIFRDAPHLLVASTPRHAPCAKEDCMIALSYFDLFAQANGVGTLWCGLGKLALDDLLPETRDRLGIPQDHLVGYAMLFGYPAVSYARIVKHGPALISRFDG